MMCLESDSSGVTIQVEVAYATPAKQTLLRIEVPNGCTVAGAIERSGIRAEHPEIEAEPESVGIFSRKVSLEQGLSEGDRVEIYRPLLADPKEVRRKRARQKPA